MKAFDNETLATSLGHITWQNLNTTLNESTHSGEFTSKEGMLGSNGSFIIKVRPSKDVNILHNTRTLCVLRTNVHHEIKKARSEKRFPDSSITLPLAETLGPILMLKSSRLKSIFFAERSGIVWMTADNNTLVPFDERRVFLPLPLSVEHCGVCFYGFTAAVIILSKLLIRSTARHG